MDEFTSRAVLSELKGLGNRLDEIAVLLDEGKRLDLFKSFLFHEFRVVREIRGTVHLAEDKSYFFDLEGDTLLNVTDVLFYRTVEHAKDWSGYYWFERCFIVQCSYRHELRDDFYLDNQAITMEDFIEHVLKRNLVGVE